MSDERREYGEGSERNRDEADPDAWETRHAADRRGSISDNPSGFPDKSSRSRASESVRGSEYARPSGGAYPDYDRGERQGFGDWARSNRGRLRSMWDEAAGSLARYYGRDEPQDRRDAGHRGKGPRGYRRSAERIREDVCDRLTEDPELDASDIEVEVAEGEVTLSGFVDSRWAKRRAEDCADSVVGVMHVQNNLRVNPAGE